MESFTEELDPQEAKLKNPKAVVLFTGGKDSTLAYHEAVKDGYEIVRLVTFGSGHGFRAHPLELCSLQAECLGLPYEMVQIELAPGESGTPGFLNAYRRAIVYLKESYGVSWLVSGDILDVAENFMPRACQGTGVSMVRPLWEKPRGAILDGLAGYDFIVTCCNLKKMKKEMAEDLMLKRGPELLKALQRLAADNGGDGGRGDPNSGKVDAAGEHGEYHTMVLDAPLFQTHRLQEEGSPVLMTSEDHLLLLDFSSVKYTTIPKA